MPENTGMTARGFSRTPIYEKYSLTPEEAADYFGIGQKKIRQIIEEHFDADFVLHNGRRTNIKRKKFELFLDRTNTI